MLDLSSLVYESEVYPYSVQQLIFASLKESLGKYLYIGLLGHLDIYEIVNYHKYYDLHLVGFKKFKNLIGICVENSDYILSVVINKRYLNKTFIKKLRRIMHGIFSKSNSRKFCTRKYYKF